MGYIVVDENLLKYICMPPLRRAYPWLSYVLFGSTQKQEADGLYIILVGDSDGEPVNITLVASQLPSSTITAVI